MFIYVSKVYLYSVYSVISIQHEETLGVQTSTLIWPAKVSHLITLQLYSVRGKCLIFIILIYVGVIILKQLYYFLVYLSWHHMYIVMFV